MKIFFNGGGYHQLVNTLQRKGHQVIQYKTCWINYIYSQQQWEDYNKNILRQQIIEAKPDVYICSKGAKNNLFIQPEVTQWIKKRVGTTVYWSQDDPFFMSTFTSRKMYLGYDIALTCTKDSFSRYQSFEIKPYLFWPAFDSEYRKVVAVPEEKKIDFIFVGTPYACTDIPRKDILLWAIQQKMSVEIYGPAAWITKRAIKNGKNEIFIQGDEKLAPYYKGKWKDWTSLHHLFARAKLTFSNHVQKATLYMNDRVPIVMGAGGCLILDNNPGMENVFKHNHEVIFYKDWKTLAHRTLYFLHHENARISMGLAAREKILKEHTYANRAEQLLSIIENRK